MENGFWFLMLFFELLIPGTMILTGDCFRKGPPKHMYECAVWVPNPAIHEKSGYLGICASVYRSAEKSF
jgi:hypothetical protein